MYVFDQFKQNLCNNTNFSMKDPLCLYIVRLECIPFRLIDCFFTLNSKLTVRENRICTMHYTLLKQLYTTSRVLQMSLFKLGFFHLCSCNVSTAIVKLVLVIDLVDLIFYCTTVKSILAYFDHSKHVVWLVALCMVMVNSCKCSMANSHHALS